MHMPAQKRSKRGARSGERCEGRRTGVESPDLHPQGVSGSTLACARAATRKRRRGYLASGSHSFGSAASWKWLLRRDRVVLGVLGKRGRGVFLGARQAGRVALNTQT